MTEKTPQELRELAERMQEKVKEDDSKIESLAEFWRAVRREDSFEYYFRAVMGG